jgi:hypothetical protein
MIPSCHVNTFGRALPHCYSERMHKIAIDANFTCLNHPEGMLLSTHGDESFPVLNGIQTQSARTLNLGSEPEDSRQRNADLLRISTQSSHTKTIIHIFQGCGRDTYRAAAATVTLGKLMQTGPCNGYCCGDAGMDALQHAAL